MKYLFHMSLNIERMIHPKWIFVNKKLHTCATIYHSVFTASFLIYTNISRTGFQPRSQAME